MYACHFRPFLTAGLILSIGVESPLSAAERPAAHWHAPSPADGHAQWIENAPLNVMTLARTGWIQFVRIEGLDGMVVEFATASGTVRVVTPAVVGLATGMTYRVRLTNIPSRPQVDLHPTLQLIGFLAPPANVSPQAHPIRLRFDLRDIDDASFGKHLRNAVYLEDPESAIPIAFPADDVPMLDLAPGENPLDVASGLGRPLILVQLGNRLPMERDDAVNPPVFLLDAAATLGDLAAVRINALRLLNMVEWQFAAGPLGLLPPADVGGPAALCHRPTSAQRGFVHDRMPDDERICNGGDKLPYVYQQFRGGVSGVQPADTAAVYNRPGDRPRLVTSNTVCVYSPRFGIVRSEWLAAGRTQVDNTFAANQIAARQAMRGRERSDTDQQRSRVSRLRQADRAVQTEMRELASGVQETRVIAAARNREGIAMNSGWQLITALRQGDAARLAAAIEAAGTFARHDFPAYTALTESGGQVSGNTRTAQVEQFREPYRRPGDIEIQKLTTSQSAQSGDTIEFYILYRNHGQQPVEGLSIIDNLVPRLEYVPGTAQSDRGAVFTASPNNVGAQELRWDIPGMIRGGDQGAVWFQARVR